MCLFYRPLRSDGLPELLLSKGHLHFFSEIQVGTLDQERNLFLFFFRAPCILRTTGIFGYNRGLLLSVLTRIRAHLLGQCFSQLEMT